MLLLSLILRLEDGDEIAQAAGEAVEIELEVEEEALLDTTIGAGGGNCDGGGGGGEVIKLGGGGNGVLLLVSPTLLRCGVEVLLVSVVGVSTGELLPLLLLLPLIVAVVMVLVLQVT